MSSSPDIRLISHKGFDETYEEIDDKEEHVQIELAIMDIRNNPHSVSRFMQAKYEGYREHIRGSYRIIFAICSECISHGYVDDIDCADCEEIHGQDQIDPQPVLKLIHLENIEPVRHVG